MWTRVAATTVLAVATMGCDVPIRTTVAYIGDSHLKGALHAIVEQDVWRDGRAPYFLAPNPGYGLLRDVEYFVTRLESAAPYSALVVVLGTNDAVKRAGEDKPLYNYDALTDRIAAAVPEGRGIVWVLPDTSLGDRFIAGHGVFPDTVLEVTRFQRVKDAMTTTAGFDAMAGKHRHAVVDLAQVMAGCPECYHPDGVHYTDAGNVRLAKAISEQLGELGL
jgi:hypothetical protein